MSTGATSEELESAVDVTVTPARVVTSELLDLASRLVGRVDHSTEPDLREVVARAGAHRVSSASASP